MNHHKAWHLVPYCLVGVGVMLREAPDNHNWTHGVKHMACNSENLHRGHFPNTVAKNKYTDRTGGWVMVGGDILLLGCSYSAGKGEQLSCPLSLPP